MYILSTAYLCFHVKATLFETVYLFMVGSVYCKFHPIVNKHFYSISIKMKTEPGRVICFKRGLLVHVNKYYSYSYNDIIFTTILK